jgi:hypothetical protein
VSLISAATVPAEYTKYHVMSCHVMNEPTTEYCFTHTWNEQRASLRLEFITNLMHNFIYSIIILHHDSQHVPSIAVLIFDPLLIGALYGSIQSVTIPDTVNIQLSS